jgi:hypothetical protein
VRRGALTDREEADWGLGEGEGEDLQDGEELNNNKIN